MMAELIQPLSQLVAVRMVSLLFRLEFYMVAEAIVLGNYVHMLLDICVSACYFMVDPYTNISGRVSVGIPDPILGPKGIRVLLVFRGLSGYVASALPFAACVDPSCPQVLLTLLYILLPEISVARGCHGPHLPSAVLHGRRWCPVFKRGFHKERSICKL